MGFNLYPLPLGTYTIIFEYFFPEDSGIQLSCQATTAYVHKQVQKDFTDYSKLLVQINNNSKITPDYIYLTIHGTAVVSNPEGYIIVYGVKDWSDSVKSDVYDSDFYTQMFEYKNDDMFMNTDIDMNNHRFKNVPKPTSDTDVLLKGSLNLGSANLYGLIHNDKYFKVNNIDVSFDFVFINSITLIQDSFRGQSDEIIINYQKSTGGFGRLHYSFIHTSSSSNITVVMINRSFKTGIQSIKTQTSTGVSFIITYQTTYF